MKSFTKMSVLILPILLLMSPIVESGEKEHYSGFLGDYSKLKKTKGADGRKVARWEDPKLNRKNYQKVMLEDVVFYPAPKPSAQVNTALLKQIKDYLTNAMRKEIGQEIEIVNEPGPGVIRVRTAITGVSAEKKGFKAYEILPIALIKSGVEAAAGGRNMEVFILAEVEVTDSQSGEVIGQAVRRNEAAELKNDEEKLKLKHVIPMLDDWAKGARTYLSENMNENINK